MKSCAAYACSEDDGQPTAVEVDDTTQPTARMMRPTMHTRSPDSGILSRCEMDSANDTYKPRLRVPHLKQNTPLLVKTKKPYRQPHASVNGRLSSLETLNE